MPEWNKKPFSEAEMKEFCETMWPAQPVDNPKELEELLDNAFSVLPGEEGNDDEDMGLDNFYAYCRSVGGLAWINALHDFGEDDGLQTPLTYLSAAGDDWRLLEILLSHGADTNVRNAKGQPLLLRFMREQSFVRRFRFFDLLLQNGANPHAFYRGKTMVEYAKMFSSHSASNQVDRMVYESLQQDNRRR